MIAQKDKIVHVLMDKYGTTFAEDAGIKIKNVPSELFLLLCASMLFSTRISSGIAVQAARELQVRGWDTPEKMLSVSWDEKVRALDKARYARYDESTASRLEQNSRLLIEKYEGDLRNLREKAGRSSQRERSLLREFAGIGDVGVNIFFREVQVIWDELYPFVDDKVMQAAEELGLPGSGEELSELVDKKDFSRFVDALVKVNLSHGYSQILESLKE